MLVYVATWPRCGNSLTRSLLFTNFRLLIANGYEADAKRPEKLRPEYFGDFIRYQQDGCPPYIGLQNNALARLNDNPQLRRDCAALSEIFFVKTHELPPEDPIEGEAYVCMTRHPVRAAASYRKLWPEKELRFVLDGAYVGGRYDDWHDGWEASGMPNVTVRYEDVINDPGLLIHPVSELIDRPAPEVVREMPMAVSKDMNPSRNPGLLLDGWRDVLSREEAEWVWSEMGETASRYGYTDLLEDQPMAEPTAGSESGRGATASETTRKPRWKFW